MIVDDQRLARGAVVRADKQVDILLKHQPHRRFGGLRRRAAGVGREQFDLTPKNAAVLVDLVCCEFGAGSLRWPEKRRRAAQRDKQADLEVARGVCRPYQARSEPNAEPAAAVPSMVRRVMPFLLLAHLDVSLVCMKVTVKQVKRATGRRRQLGQQLFDRGGDGEKLSVARKSDRTARYPPASPTL